MIRTHLKWNKNKALDELRKCDPTTTFEELKKRNYPLLNACVRYCGSFNNAKFAAGLPIRTEHSQIKQLPKDIKISPELGYVAGVILGDGFISFGSNRCVGLNTIDLDFASFFKEQLKKLSSLESIVYTTESRKVFCKARNKVYNYKKEFCVRLFSLKLCSALKKFVDDISWMYDSDRKVKIMVLKGLWDSEGYLSRHGTVGFCNSNLKIIELYQNLCKEFGIITSLVIRKNIKHFEVRLAGKESKINFFNLIGITIGRKREIFLNHKFCNSKKFTEEERYFIFKNYRYLSDSKMAMILNRSYNSILHFRDRNGLLKGG
jgi:hypothetical protein